MRRVALLQPGEVLRVRFKGQGSPTASGQVHRAAEAIGIIKVGVVWHGFDLHLYPMKRGGMETGRDEDSLQLLLP